MAKVAEKLEQVATTQPVFQFWWVTGAILDALRTNGLEASLTLKRLLGQADRQIKALYEIGETRYCENPPVDLLNNMLYYVARATNLDGRVGAVRASFKLSELLPIDDAIEHERESLSAPSVKLMRTVAAAIKEDLSKVKDALDLFARRGDGNIAELAPQLELLKKISDTLGVLGLGELRQRVQQEVADLSALLASQQTPPQDALLKVAGVLLSVEDSLDDQLVRLILPQGEGGAAAAHAETGDLEFRQVSEAVLRECIVNLARIKEAISTAVQRPGDFSAQGLDNVPQLLRGIAAGLLMLGKTRAVELMEAIGVHVRKLVEPGARAPDPVGLERVADAIVSLEYYMETLQNGRNDPWYMLDNAETCLKALDAELTARLPSVSTLGTTDSGATDKLDYQATVKLGDEAAVRSATLPVVRRPEAPALDPQMLELFIEEAKEEMASIGAVFPRWDQNPMDTDSLASLRRSFHTLKGSGRMVGARRIGDFAWAIENLLNRIIDKTLTRTPGMMAVMRSAVGVMPHLIEQLETGRLPPAGIDDILARAYAFADGRDTEQTYVNVTSELRAPFSATQPQLEATEQPAAAHAATAAHADPDVGAVADAQPHGEPAAEASAEAANDAGADTRGEPPQSPPAAEAGKPRGMDPLLRDIYSKETAVHLDELREYLRRRRGQLAPHALPEAVYRAVHTLSGSSKMAEARHGVRVTEPLNHYIRKVYESGLGLSDAGLAVLADSVAAIENVMSHIDETTIFFGEQPELLERLRLLDADLDAHLAHAAQDSAASSVVPILEPPPEPLDAFDHEIANIYSEEATELLEAAQASLNSWNADRKAKDPVAELQRQLHTLKGGARMAGIAAMGDLSHEVETLVIQIDAGAVVAGDPAYTVLQNSLDELARMRDTVSGGSLPSPARALMAQIRALSAGQGAAAAPPTSAASEPDGHPSAPPILSLVPPAARDTSQVAREPAAAARDPDDSPPAADAERVAAPAEAAVQPILPGRETLPVERAEMARVDADLLDVMLNNAGEVSIFRARLGQQVNSIDFNLVELARTVTRLKEQLRGLQIETETQVLNRHQDNDARRTDFDPLELDRYSALHQFSRALAETSSDVASIQGLLETLTREAQNLLTQQARVITDLQNSLLRTRMVPFQRHVQRLTRLVRQAANDTGKRAELVVEGAAAELDRQVLERMVPPLEHMLRNAVVHGIETAGAAEPRPGKHENGRITVSLERDGAEVVIVVADDGAGINVNLIREKAISLGLADPDAKLTDEETMQLILEPGFSTAGLVTQAAGRGVGMDVVATEVKKLGGGLFIESRLGRGHAIHDPPAVHAGDQPGADRARRRGVLCAADADGRGRRASAAEHRRPPPRQGCAAVRVRRPEIPLPASRRFRGSRRRAAAGTRRLDVGGADPRGRIFDRAGHRRIGRQPRDRGQEPWVRRSQRSAALPARRSSATAASSSSSTWARWCAPNGAPARGNPGAASTRDRRSFALVVDDSITVRRVTQRLLERNGMRVLTAKDGVEAVSLLQDNLPDIILLDIEMPRMDGYEVAAHVRNDPRLKRHPDHHDHFARQRKAPRPRDRARRGRLSGQALSGKPAARRDRAAAQPAQCRGALRRRRVSDLREELYSLLVPLVGERLLVPRACVAEVIGYQTPVDMTNAPPWYLGLVAWGGRNVPVVSFEGVLGMTLPTVSGRTRIVVFNAPEGRIQTGFFGVLTHGFPQLVRVNADVIRPDPSRSFAERSPVICQVRMVNETPLIPDLQRLEQMIAEETSVLG